MFKEQSVMWTLWVSSSIIQIHPGMKSLMCWVESLKPALGKLPEAAGERTHPGWVQFPTSRNILQLPKLEFWCLGQKAVRCAASPEPEQSNAQNLQS